MKIIPNKEVLLSLIESQRNFTLLPCSLHDVYWMDKKHGGYESIDYITLDGMPLVWFFRWSKKIKTERGYGPDILDSILKEYPRSKHCFLGSRRSLSFLTKRIMLDHVSYIPLPFAEQASELLTKSILSDLDKINADFLWIAIGSPKQVIIARQLKDSGLATKIMCVGAAVDIYSGLKTQAPKIMRQFGLEWLFRLLQEPRRLMCRYFFLSPTAFISIVSGHSNTVGLRFSTFDIESL